ncbi:CAP domain-containing protein [Microbulbifer yueqingensis]|uniref:Cysteine-rich secretory protein family protein n=1 Tax=Microbulbifer yueqingensis TaxID=658219 RepID=A0A1G9CL34_9GAMM|nr:CAP domain-containing protein [Microbulbifer yueqingensis]SDK52390.1 Cysteine-rich secretory protein family protein [Microbulbifer yueqingensis]
MKQLPATGLILSLLLAGAIAAAPAAAGPAASGATHPGLCLEGDSCPAVRLHNQVRQRLNRGKLPNSPKPLPPVDMLVHDRALAVTAFNWARHMCERDAMQHNRNRVRDYHANGGNRNYTHVGENLAVFSHTASTGFPPGRDAIARAVDLWVSEAADYRYRRFRTRGPMVGHYTQVIWNSTEVFDSAGNRLPKAVGCGSYQCRAGRWYKTYVACNYAPVGNFINQYPYRAE